MSILYVSVERRYKYHNGNYYVQGIEDAAFFARYLDIFTEIYVIARVEKVKEQPKGFKLFRNNHVHIEPIFTTGTGINNITKILQINNKIKKSNASVILRTPGILSYLLSLYFVLFNIQFSLEVVTNPLQEAKNLTANKILKKIFVIFFLSIFKMQLKKCQYASFVTKNEIQRIFLSQKEYQSDRYNSYYSSILLNEGDSISKENLNARISRLNKAEEFHMLFIGVLDRPFKGLDIFLKIVSTLPGNYYATVIGDGHLLDNYKKMALSLNIIERVKFEGYISDIETKHRIMSESDLFVLTSRREGLPRVIIEAMAYGLPCFSSNVSGVAELISEDCIFPVDDWQAAVNIITGKTSEDLIRLSKENLANSFQYKNSILKKRRADFYKKVIRSENFTFE
ncbi:glycosyltransferase [Enterobacter cloacae]|uniref:glycosyltransferase n=1 Tax=Enterobacter cloacae TaxID=550 RepID=UPI0029C083F4|nr:glycosyltransferase [Enterobacter cloacae]